MAYYAALTPLLQLLEDIIVHDRYPDFHFGEHRVMDSIHKKFTLLEESLEGYSSKGDEANDHVEGRIRDVAYRAQDIIEYEIFGGVSAPERFDSYVEELQMVNQEIDSVLEEMKVIKERQTREDSNIRWGSSNTSAAKQAPIGRNVMVGFDDDLTTIKGQLYGNSSRLEVISIVGTGGIGKSTLARHTYEDSHAVYRFDRRAWAVVSQDFNMNQFLHAIATSLGINTNELLRKDEGALKEHIYKRLKGMRYLIVIDDIWSREVWNDVKQIFPNDNSGSRIMLTTRLSDVAEYASASNFVHNMHFLSDDQSWDLLQQKVFGQEQCAPELVDIGKSIARNCFGLPLAIVVIAGVLSTKSSPYDWEKIASSVRKILSDKDEHLPSILSLSYNHLSHQLKACFLYLGNYPEDQEINISNVIKLWIAEGFLKFTERNKILEERAGECLEDLVKRNLVLVTKKRSNGQPKFCVLHDLLRDFCRQRAFHENFFHVEQEDGDLQPKGNGDVRQLNCYVDNYYHRCETGKHVRSIHFFRKGFALNLDSFKWDNLKLLRVFDAFEARNNYFSDVMIRFQLANLKYLGFDPVPHFLPSSFMNQNLQTLILSHPDHVYSQLPPQIWEMAQLRHLIGGHICLPHIPPSSDICVKKLECLQTLMRIEDFKFTNDAIQMIPKVRKLKVTCHAYGQKGRRWDQLYCLNKLYNLSQLEELGINYQHCFNVIESLPNEFCFPLNLTQLSLHGCHLPWEDMRCVGSLPHLQVLRLKYSAFVGEEWKPKDEEFLHLKFLLLHRLNLKYWRADETHFPCLEHLEIKDCDDLEMIPLEIGDIPTLNVIKLMGGNEQDRESAILIQEEQSNQGNDTLQVYA